jgi:hypothetical protein
MRGYARATSFPDLGSTRLLAPGCGTGVMTCGLLQEMSIPFSKAILDLNNRNVMNQILAEDEFELDSDECAYQVHFGLSHALSLLSSGCSRPSGQRY